MPAPETHLRNFIKFLEKRQLFKVGGTIPSSTPRNNRCFERTTAHLTNTLATCPVYSANHLYHCDKFKELDVGRRREKEHKSVLTVSPEAIK